MCNRYRVSAKQLDLAKQYGFPVDQLMPDPERMPSPELFPKKPGWIVRKHGRSFTRGHDVGHPAPHEGQERQTDRPDQLV